MKKITRTIKLTIAMLIGVAFNSSAQEIMVDGGFESGTLASWTILGVTPTPVISTTPHSGTYSTYIGTAAGAEPLGDGSLYQTITVPAAGGTLSYWYLPNSTDGITFDWQDAYITNTSGTILATIMHVCSNAGVWTNVTYNMAAFAGQTVRVEFLVHQDGFGDDTGMYVDDVSLPTPANVLSVYSFTPTFGCGSTTTVVITGNLFTGVTAVLFGGTNALSYVVNSGSQITATVGTGTTGTIQVVTGAGTATSAGTFTVFATPVVSASSASPAAYCVGSGGSSNLNATSAGNTINWWDAASGGTLLTNVPSGTNYSVSPASTTTYYAEAVAPSAGGGAIPAGYCSPIMYPSNACNYLSSVSTSGATANFTNNTNIYDGTGFTFFSGSSASQQIGSSFTLTCQAQGTCNIAYYNVWVDWNRDGDFADVGESVIVANGANSTNAVTNFTISIPGGASPGNTRMRVMVDGNSANPTTACDDFSGYYSEVEDYVLNIMSGSGCISSPRAAVTVTVNALPTISANTTAMSICIGDNVTLTGGGAVSYTWDNGVSDGIAFSPSATTTYQVTGTDGNGCVNTASIIVPVNSLPTVTANASATTVCAGDMETLTGSGTATSYAWDNGVTDAVAFATTSTTTYNVVGTDGNGCMNTDAITVTVNSLPTVTANASATSICIGDSETLTGSGTATSYTWDNGVTDALAFAPAGTTTYMVTGTDGNGCMNMDMITVTVNALPTVTANASATTICMGDMETLTGSGTATSYTWDNGVTDALAFSPAGTTTYMVTGTDGNGCVNMDMITVTVNSLPTVTANASATTVCAGDMETLTGSGTATSYAWDNGVTDAVAFATTTTTTYMVTGTDGNGCMNMDMTTVTVNALPTVTANASASSICMGDSETLTGSGTATSYTWDNGVTDALAFTPAGTATYMITGTDGNGCTNTDMITVTVNALPTVTYTETMTMVCENWAAFTLAAGAPAGGVYSGNSVTGSSFDPTAAGAGTFTITYTYTDGNTCSSFATSDIVVDACTGVTANGSLSSLVVYPNPSTGVYYITIDKATKVTIYNTLGEMVYDNEMNAGNNEIDMNGFANGMYSLKAVQGNNQQTIHLIKN